MLYRHTKFQVETHQRGGLVGNKAQKSRKSGKGKPGQGGPLWDNSAYLCQHRRDIAQTFMVHSPTDALQSHKVSGQNSPRGRVGGQKSPKNPVYLHQHRWDITQPFMVDSPSDNIQTHKVLGPNSPRDRVRGRKGLENHEKVMKSCPSEAPGRALARTRAKRGRMTIQPQNHRTTGP